MHLQRIFRTKALLWAMGFALFMMACGADNGERAPETAADSTAYKTDLEHGDFTGSWRTPSPYNAYESAQLSVREQEDGIAGVLRYARADKPGGEAGQSRRFVWDGQMQGNTAIIDIRDDDGLRIGQARLALMGNDMAVQLLEPAPALPEIFVVRRAEEVE